MADKRVYTDQESAENRVGVCTPTYKVIRFMHMETTNKAFSHNRRFDLVDAVYECQCTINSEHPPFTRTGMQIDKHPDQTGCRLCVNQGNTDRAKQKAMNTWIGAKVGGALCIDYAGTSKYSGPRFIWVCPFCGETFEKEAKLLKMMAANHDLVDCGCQAYVRKRASQAKTSRYVGGLFSNSDPLTAKKANMARDIIGRTTDPLHPSYKNFGGRTTGNPILRTGDWNTGDYATDIRNIIDWLTLQGLTIDDDRHIGRYDANKHYNADNCALMTPREIYDNHISTIWYQYGNQVYTRSTVNDIFGYSVRTLIRKRTPSTVSKDMYERDHITLMLKLNKHSGLMYDQDGFIRTVPASHVFFRYPDWYNGPISNYLELGPRILDNIEHSRTTRLIKNWTTEEELIDIGVDPDSPLIEWVE